MTSFETVYFPSRPMRKIYLCLFALFTLTGQLLNAQQVELDRVAQMPDLPSAYAMRDWKDVARKYDSLVFDISQEGEHLPIVTLGSEGINFPEIQPVFMDSYVGSSSHGQQREAINIIPAIVGATLVGADKTSQFNVDWVTKVRDFYNIKNEELVYLNGPSDNSGHDWWYETMPNVFFYQLYDLYPSTDGFESQFISVADRWLAAVEAMGANDAPWTQPEMNYRAWSLTVMQPLDEGVKEPEAAGAIAWILYQAYQHTSDEKYLVGAQWALDFLNSETENPSYELQLPYGVLTAAKLNAELGANYDLEKLLNWCFDRGDLRGWGSVVGTWGGEDVSGLIGEANDQGNDYVFLMNGFQQAASLAPLVKYDKRYAKSIAKWILNVANASRLFYSNYLPENQQSDYAWSQANDPHSVIAYEAIKETWEGTELYARGDSKEAGWAETNLGLYGSSHVGYLGALIDETNVDGILQIDVNATDFYSANEFPTYLYFNPYDQVKAITLEVGTESHDLYDAISETVIQTNVNGSQTINIPAKGVILVSLLPPGSALEEVNGKLYAGEKIVDYHYGYDFSSELRIKSLASSTDQLELGASSSIYCTTSGAESVSYQWFVNDELQEASVSELSYTPVELGEVKIKVIATFDGQSVSDSLDIEVVELIPEPPVINAISSESNWFRPGANFSVEASVTDPKGLDLTYNWSVTGGEFVSENGAAIEVSAEEEGVVSVMLTVTNGTESSTSIKEFLIVEQNSLPEPVLQLSMNETVSDLSANHFSTSLSGGSYVEGPEEAALEALRLSSASHELLVTNSDELNFLDHIGISLWVKFTNFSEERFLISHGSWEQRWKLSTTADKKLRWTVNTTTGIKDLDSSEEMEVDRWYHVAVAYNGSSMQMYIDGMLNAFIAHSGQLNQSSVAITVGKRLPGDEQYDIRGSLDEVRIYDEAFDPESMVSLLSEWSPKIVTGLTADNMTIYPNPATSSVQIKVSAGDQVELYDFSGRMVKAVLTRNQNASFVTVDVQDIPEGVYLIRTSSSSLGHSLIIKR